MLVAHLAHAAAVRALNLNRHGTYSFTHQNPLTRPVATRAASAREGEFRHRHRIRDAPATRDENHRDFFAGLLGSSFM